MTSSEKLLIGKSITSTQSHVLYANFRMGGLFLELLSISLKNKSLRHRKKTTYAYRQSTKCEKS